MVNSINNITDKIILMAKKYEDVLNEETQRQIAEIKEEYQSKAEYINKKILSDTRKECDEILARSKSEADFRRRNIILSAKVNMLDLAMESAKKKIIGMTDNDYIEFNSNMLKKTIREYEKWVIESASTYNEDYSQSKYIIKLNAADKARVANKLLEAAKSCTNKEVEIDGRDFDIDGGFVFASGNIEVNCTVKSIIDNKRGQIVGKLNQVLFGNDA